MTPTTFTIPARALRWTGRAEDRGALADFLMGAASAAATVRRDGSVVVKRTCLDPGSRLHPGEWIAVLGGEYVCIMSDGALAAMSGASKEEPNG